MGPSLAGCGIFRPVRIEGFCTAKIDNLHIRTVDCNQHYADVRVAVTPGRAKHRQTSLRCKLHFSGGGLNLTQELAISAHENQHATLIHIDRPILWWPRGYGVQHQYHLRAELYQSEQLLDVTETDFGIRTLRVNRSADKTGTTFQFEVNEQPIYVKGANWVPLSIFPGSQTKADYEWMLTQAANAHFNMLRVWAGGFYENPEFYRLCDKLGILVWQDFMFASAYYPDRQWFATMVEQEAECIIRRLRNHPSLALWCGNSRIDSLHETGRLGTGRKFYGKGIYHELLPKRLSELDPNREYIPTTPFSDLKRTDCFNPASGTTHCWNVWNYYAEVDSYETAEQNSPRFVTEFGMQSIPCMETLLLLGINESSLPGVQALEKHNYQPGGGPRIARYIADCFNPSRKLKENIWQSQVVQARAAKRNVEYLRSHNTINHGCLFWTFNDLAPCVSFSAIDALKNPKALYYYAKRFFTPVLVTQVQDKKAGLCCIAVVNDSSKRITANLDCRLLDFSGSLIDHLQMPVTVSPFSRSGLSPLPKSFSKLMSGHGRCLHLNLLADGLSLAENVYFFGPDKHIQWPAGDIELEITQKGETTWQVALESKGIVRDLQLIAPCAGQFSDNFVTLLPGRIKTIHIQFEKAPMVSTPVQILCANDIQ
jgi:beta-mannosidase